MAENLKSLFVVWSMLSMGSLITSAALPAAQHEYALRVFAVIQVIACLAVIGIYFHG